MRINVRNTSFGLQLAIFIIKVFIALASILSFLGFSLLRTAGVEYLKEQKARRKNSEPVKAVVREVRREFGKDTVRGYEIVSYEYNGESYVSEVEAYIESSGSYSSGNSSVKPDSDSSDRSEEHWNKLQESIGTEEELYVDPAEPENAVHLATAEVMHALGVMTLFGILPFVILILLIAALVVVGRKAARKIKEEGF